MTARNVSKERLLRQLQHYALGSNRLKLRGDGIAACMAVGPNLANLSRTLPQIALR
jgi:hypothetical protein